MPKFCRRSRKPVTRNRRPFNPRPFRRSSPATTSSASRRPARARRRRSRCRCSPSWRRSRRRPPARHPRAGARADARTGVADRGERPGLRASICRCAWPTVFGGVGEHPQINALRAGTDVVIACPGRLMDLMQRRYADFSQLQYLVLDEADRMLDMGFLPSIRQIVRSLPQATADAACFPPRFRRKSNRSRTNFSTRRKLMQIGRRANPAETVTQLVYEVPKHLKTALLLHLLKDPRDGHGAGFLAHETRAPTGSRGSWSRRAS